MTRSEGDTESLLPSGSRGDASPSNVIAMTKEQVATATIRFTVLLMLMLQNASHALLTRYSQGILKESYSSTEVVLVSEIIKMCVAGYLTMRDKTETDAVGRGFSKLWWLAVNSKKVIVLVILYSTANILAYYALERVEASVYTVTLQLKIITTAVFAIIIIGRHISATKWRALLLLVVGCVLVASPAFNKDSCDGGSAASGDSSGVSEESEAQNRLDTLVGVACIFAMVAISGYSAIYFENMLKRSNEHITIWERNFQLALFSIIFLVAVVVGESMQEGAEMHEVHSGMFQGWTTLAVVISLVQALGGLLVAATLKYADAILKTLATSGAIVISAVLNWMLLGGTLDMFVSMGCISTILAIFNYILDKEVPKQASHDSK